MSDSPDPALKFASTLRDLAEGRIEPAAWIAWWNANAVALEAAIRRGWYLRLKPTQLEIAGVNKAAYISQQGACQILEALQVPFDRSDRYKQAWNEDFQRFCAEQKDQNDLRARQFQPRLAAMAELFPKLSRFLKKRVGDIDQMEEPASASEIKTVELSLGAPLPSVCRHFLQCTKALRLNGLEIALDKIFRHAAVVVNQSPAAGSICIADYWLEADGDQVLLEYKLQPADDPPVFYYSHTSGGVSAARKLASSFSHWIESLPRSPVFRA